MLTILHQVMADGRKPITTQIFDKASKYLDDDSVFCRQGFPRGGVRGAEGQPQVFITVGVRCADGSL